MNVIKKIISFSLAICFLSLSFGVICPSMASEQAESGFSMSSAHECCEQNKVTHNELSFDHQSTEQICDCNSDLEELQDFHFEHFVFDAFTVPSQQIVISFPKASNIHFALQRGPPLKPQGPLFLLKQSFLI